MAIFELSLVLQLPSFPRGPTSNKACHGCLGAVRKLWTKSKQELSAESRCRGLETPESGSEKGRLGWSTGMAILYLGLVCELPPFPRGPTRNKAYRGCLGAVRKLWADSNEGGSAESRCRGLGTPESGSEKSRLGRSTGMAIFHLGLVR
jgi:hypothetical protein